MNPERHNARLFNRRRLAVRASVLVSAGRAGGECAACSTILLARGPVPWLGDSLDEVTDFPGFVCVNKRDVLKVGCRWDELRSPSQGFSPALFQLQWIQHHLDNGRTVEEVICSASRMVPRGWPWHFFACDQRANRATIEYPQGKLIIHTGPTMPVSVLCNSPYRSELDALKRYEGFGGRRRLSLANPKTPRFARAAQLLSDFNPESPAPAADYCFGVLQNLSSKLTRRSHVVDLRNRMVHFCTDAVPEKGCFRLEALDFGPATPVQILDLDVRGSGDGTARFAADTFEAHRRSAEGWVRHVQERFPDADTASSPPGIIIDATLSRPFIADRDPLGHRIKLGGPDSTAPWMTIVGVVGEVKHDGSKVIRGQKPETRSLPPASKCELEQDLTKPESHCRRRTCTHGVHCKWRFPVRSGPPTSRAGQHPRGLLQTWLKTAQ